MKMLKTMLLMLVVTAPVLWAQASGMQTYIVLYQDQAVPADSASVISSAGGSLLASYAAIGVAVARSDSDQFRTKLLDDSRVEGVAATGNFGVKLRDEVATPGTAESSVVNTSVPGNDNLSSLQWDMDQIHAPEARAINGGSRSVVAGVVDTGLDFTHPDLAPNVDFTNSVSCQGGVPDQDPAAWYDVFGHGTRMAGIIAAAKNGTGIVGVAPNVKVAAIRVADDNEFDFPEAIVCGFVWAGTHHIDVLNNSYFADPWLFNCRNDRTQHAIWKAEQRAIRFAMTQGVTVVAPLTNNNDDLSKKNIDSISPDNGTPLTREVTNACVIIPVEIPGVIGVSGNGNLLQKAFSSDYGVGVTQVVAPSGDPLVQRTAAAPNGRILSTFPADLILSIPPAMRVFDCTISPCATYNYGSGNSSAAPHVTGVAALVISQFGKMPPGKVQALITQTADPQPCPPNPFDPDGTGAYLATCAGGVDYNGFYGHGQINSLTAVTHTP